MIVLVVFSLLLIVFSAYLQYNAQSDDYNTRRLIRKEAQVKNHLYYLMERDSSFSSIHQNFNQYKQDFSSIGIIHKVDYALYSPSGQPWFYTYVENDEFLDEETLPKALLNKLYAGENKRLGIQNEAEKGKFQSAYSVLIDPENRPYAILYFPYFEDVSFSTTELNYFLKRVFQVSFFMMFITFSFAFLLSGFITRPIETFRNKIAKTNLLKQNKRIRLDYASKEIDALVSTYNEMLDVLNESAEKLAKNEREQAWQEMARQVAHEIKNPLTPMRLTVQSFQQRFDIHSEDSQQKLNDFAEILIEQIDIMSNVASAFSDFARLPQLKVEKEDLVEITKTALELFSDKKLVLDLPEQPLYWPIDRTQWIRVLTNLMKNAIQATPDGIIPMIKVGLLEHDRKVFLTIADNGSGIAKADIDKIFEPRFTTKTGGMGLGLAIVKNIIQSLNGEITFTTCENKGTTFQIILNPAEK